MGNNFANYQVLVVDGSKLTTERISSLLNEMPCVGNIEAVHDFQRAQQKISEKYFDIVLLDTQLPGNNGFELLATVKKISPDSTTIVVTNQAGEFYRIRGEKMGSDYFIDKSSEFEKIVEIISNLSNKFQVQ
jgi:DNA-binding NarL/FixJ family response regulator